MRTDQTQWGYLKPRKQAGFSDYPIATTSTHQHKNQRYFWYSNPCRTPHRKTPYKPTQITNNKLNKIILSTTYPPLSNYQISQENI